MKVHLLIDAHAPGGSGLGRYAFEMSRALAAREDFAAVHLAGPPAVMEEWRAAMRSAAVPVHIIPYQVRRYSPRIPIRWPAVARTVGAAHVTWFPHWDGSWLAPRAVTTIHDLIQLEGQGTRAALRRTVVRSWMQRMIASSHRLLTGSAGAAATIAGAFPEARNKVTVIHHGVNAEFFSRGTDDTARRAPYLLTVANKREHKRLETAIHVLARLAPSMPTLRLVMVGSRDAHAPVLRALAQSLGVAERVDDLERVDDAALAALYRGAVALLVPSRSEGFGLVVLEAMASGTPVIAVDRPPLPEVVGDAGILVPYDDAAAMAVAVASLTPDARARWIARGRARAESFTWQRAAEQVAAVLQSAAPSHD